MAPANQKGGLQSYVHRNNAPAVNGSENAGMAKKGSNEDLKVHLAGTYTPEHGHSTRANACNSKAPTQVKVEPGTGRNQASSRRQSRGQDHFYDTDADSIGDTSTVANVNGHAIKTAPTYQTEEFSSEVTDEQDSDGEESGSEEATAERLGQLDRQLRTMAHRPTGGIQSTYIKGDSYPTTTSGNPSVSDMGNGGDFAKMNTQNGVNSLQARQVDQRRQITAASNANLQGQPPPSMAQTDQDRTDNGLFARQTPSDSNNTHQQINSNFMFGKAPKQQNAAFQPPRHAQQTAPANFTAPKPSANTAQPTSTATTSERSHHAFFGQQHQHQHQQATELSSNAHVLTKSTGARTRQPIQGSREDQMRSLKPAPSADHHLKESPAATYGQTIASGNQSQEPETQLDYDITQLREMDYYSLRNEPFDSDHNAASVATDFDGQGNSITTRLVPARRSHANVQAQVFNSLSIEEWEQAGDWFLDQFGTAVSQLKVVRQQRRKAAQEYEDEIESRFKAVGQKRKQIDMAMGEMKESGGKVLQGTPKKSKTK